MTKAIEVVSKTGKPIGNLVAIKKFMERNDSLGGSQCKMSEITAFKEVCGTDELNEFGEQCRQELATPTL